MSVEEVDDIFICMMEESGYLNSNVPYSSTEYSLCGARCVDSILALSSSPRHSFPLHEAWTQLVSINVRTPYTAARTCLISLSLSLFPSLAKAINLHSMQFARSQRLAKTQLLVYASGDPERTSSSYRARKSAMWAHALSQCYARIEDTLCFGISLAY